MAWFEKDGKTFVEHPEEGPLEVKYGLPPEVKFCVRCVISNQRPSSSDPILAQPSVPDLAAGDSYDMSLEVGLPDDLPEGWWRLRRHQQRGQHRAGGELHDTGR